MHYQSRRAYLFAPLWIRLDYYFQLPLAYIIQIFICDWDVLLFLNDLHYLISKQSWLLAFIAKDILLPISRNYSCAIISGLVIHELEEKELIRFMVAIKFTLVTLKICNKHLWCLEWVTKLHGMKLPHKYLQAGPPEVEQVCTCSAGVKHES